MANDFSGDSNCVSLYRFESGALTTDSKGINTLSATSDPADDTTNYKEGSQACAFDGNDAYYRTDANLSSDFPFKSGTANLIISFATWFRPTVVPGASNYDQIIAKWTANAYSFALMLYDSKLCLCTGYNSGNSAEYTDICSVTTADQWYHVGVSINGTTGGWSVRFWDDVLETATTYSGTLSNIPLSADTAYFRISSEGAASPANFLVGTQDEVIVFKDIVTVAEFDQIRSGTYYGPAVDEIDVSQNLAQVEYRETPEIIITQMLTQVEATFSPTGIDVNQILAQVEYVEEEVTTGPTMAQLMRHGAWFGDGIKKPFWWAR